jgi:hypothetical protein
MHIIKVEYFVSTVRLQRLLTPIEITRKLTRLGAEVVLMGLDDMMFD